MKVRLVSLTQPAFGEVAKSPEDIIVYCARVSSPENQENLETGAKLLRYCIKNKHWSVFEMVDMTVEIQTSRAISSQILRHLKGLSIQEFSQRYAKVTSFETYEARRQDIKNRQNSINDLSDETKDWFLFAQQEIQKKAKELYQDALSRSIAKESARMLLPMSSSTVLFAKGSIRSWIHYCQVRRDNATQKEHRDIADSIWFIFKLHFPVVAEAVEGLENT